jgi:hypothetical protein
MAARHWAFRGQKNARLIASQSGLSIWFSFAPEKRIVDIAKRRGKMEILVDFFRTGDSFPL